MGTGTRGRSKGGNGRTTPSAKVIPLLGEPKTGSELVLRKNSHKPKGSDGVFTEIFKNIVGGKKTFMEMARLAPLLDPKLVSFVEEYDRLTSKAQQKTKLCDLCKLHDIDPLHLMGVVSEAAMKYRDNGSILIAAMNMPAVVQRSVKEALKPDGVDDRRMLFAHSGFVPTAKGTNISVLNQVAAKAQAANLQSESTLASFESTVRAADEVIHDK